MILPNSLAKFWSFSAIFWIIINTLGNVRVGLLFSTTSRNSFKNANNSFICWDIVKCCYSLIYAEI